MSRRPERREERARAWGGAAGLVLIALYGWLALAAYRSASPPDLGPESSGNGRFLGLGPAPAVLSEAAEAQVLEALELLEDTELATPERIRRYRERLAGAERMLRASLRANPAQARALAQLAAVRFELAPPGTDEQARPFLETVSVAAGMAPRVPRVQRQLGELLLRMGRREEALEYLRRVVELSPGHTRQVVELLRRYFFDAGELLDALPLRAETLVAVQPAFLEAGRAAEYLAAVEAYGSFPAPELMRAYGAAAVRAGQAERLRKRLRSLGPLDRPELEAERSLQLSEALLKLGQPREALAAARSARERMPDDPRFSQRLGAVALQAGEGEIAVRAFRDTLSVVARNAPGSTLRATLYRQIGQAQELCGRPDRAYDAYRRALSLDPDEPVAARRFREMREAAVGTTPE